MNPLKSILNLVTNSPARGGRNVLTGQPFQPARPGGLDALSPDQRAEMKTTRMQQALSFSDPRLMPHWRGTFLPLGKGLQIILPRHGEVASKVEFDDLCGFQERVERKNLALEKYNIDSVFAEFRRQQAEIIAIAATGDDAAVQKLLRFDRWTRDELQMEAQAKRAALKDARRTDCEEAGKISIAIAQRIAETAEKVAVEMEQREREQAFEWGVRFEPSLALQSVSQIVWVPLRNLEYPGTKEPQQQVAPFGLVLETEWTRAQEKLRKESGVAAEKAAAERLEEAKKEAEENAAEQQRMKLERERKHRELLIAKAKSEVELLEAGGGTVPAELRRFAAGDLSNVVGIGN